MSVVCQRNASAINKFAGKTYACKGPDEQTCQVGDEKAAYIQGVGGGEENDSSKEKKEERRRKKWRHVMSGWGKKKDETRTQGNR